MGTHLLPGVILPSETSSIPNFGPFPARRSVLAGMIKLLNVKIRTHLLLGAILPPATPERPVSGSLLLQKERAGPAMSRATGSGSRIRTKTAACARSDLASLLSEFGVCVGSGRFWVASCRPWTTVCRNRRFKTFLGNGIQPLCKSKPHIIEKIMCGLLLGSFRTFKSKAL